MVNVGDWWGWAGLFRLLVIVIYCWRTSPYSFLSVVQNVNFYGFS